MKLTTAVVVAVFCVVVYILLVQEQPINGKRIVLGDLKYKFDVIEAPANSGIVLKVAAFIASKSIFGPTIRRLLMNDNGMVYLRELAAQTNLDPLYYPMRRLNKAERAAIEGEDFSLENVSINGIGSGSLKGSVKFYGIEDYAAQYQQGVLPSTVLTKTLKTIAEWDAAGHHIFTSVLPEDVMQQARESDLRHQAGEPLSVFDGVPIAFKDMMDVRGHPAYNGRNPRSGDVAFPAAEKDDIMVARLRALGAIVLGMTVMTEGGMSPLGFNVHFQGPTNPYSASRYSGGSSSGSGVAVASGLVPVAIGYDSGGSVRLPSALCHIHGLAASFGRIPFDNRVAEDTMIKTGPMAISAADAALTFAAIAGPAAGHPFSVLYDGDYLGPPRPHLTGFNRVEDLSDVRVGVFQEWIDDCEPAVAKRTREVAAFLQSKGATLVPIRIPNLQYLSLAHGIKISSEFTSAWDAVFSHPQGYESIEENSKIQLGIGATSTGVEHLSTEKIRHYIFNYMVDLFQREGLSCVLTPTVAVTPPDLLAHTKQTGESNTALVMQFMKYVFLANFVGMPGYSVPAGFVEVEKNSEELSRDNDGASTKIKLPVGVHLLGNHWEEHVLLRIGHSIEVGFTNKLHIQNQPKPIIHFDPFK